MNIIYKPHRILVNSLSALILILTLFWCTTSNAQEDNKFPTADFSELKRTMRAKVTDVTSPLTLRLDNNETIQLIGLDIPDLDYYEPGPYSVAAQKILKDFLMNQAVDVYQTPDTKAQKKNRMGYQLAHVKKSDNDGWVQGLMLQLGLARVRTTPNTALMVPQMFEKETEARKNKIGIWSDDRYKILNEKEAQERIGSYQIVQGVIKNVALYKNQIYLNFGNNWREDFTVSISSFDEKKFLQKDIDLQQWNGKHIRVRGWLENYNGPYMKLDHPERFEEIVPVSEKAETAKPITNNSILNHGNALPSYNQ